MAEHLDGISPLIKTISEQMERDANHLLAEHDVTFSQMRVLIALNHAEGGFFTLKELERIIRVSQQTMAGIVSRLEKKGLARTVPDEQDRRVKRVLITSRGKDMAARLTQKMEDAEKQALAGLNEEEQETLRKLLRKIYSSPSRTACSQ